MKELERVKDQIRRMSKNDNEYMDEKAKRYLVQRESNVILDSRVKGLVECPY